MKKIFTGEEFRFFPSFFLQTFFLLLALSFSLPPHKAEAQGKERQGLSLFDRLAEEATLLNKHDQSDKVIALLEPHKGDPKNDSALFFNELGVAYRKKGDYPQAIQAYRAGLFRDPENPVIMKNLGDAFLFHKEYAQAIEQYQIALRSNPRFQQAHSGLGLVYYQLQRYREALEEFETVLKLDPQDKQARNFREAIRTKLKSQK